jgi:hypothetical protein
MSHGQLLGYGILIKLCSGEVICKSGKHGISYPQHGMCTIVKLPGMHGAPGHPSHDTGILKHRIT